MATEDADTTSAGTALVQVAPTASRGPASGPIARPDPTFVTHLIATAQQVPQTRHLRRAAPQEALSAYAAHLASAQRVGRRTRQTI